MALSLVYKELNRYPLNLVGKSTKFWLLWTSALLAILLIQVYTVGLLPHIQQDETQITDYGRLALNPRSDWSVTWLVAQDKPLLLWSYLGPLIIELGYQLGGLSGVGARVAALVVGIVASTMILVWLLSYRVHLYAAVCLSIGFLLDPLFTLSQRTARVDSWVIAFCLGSCWLLRSALLGKDHKIHKIQIFFAGFLTVCAAFIWPSSIILYPLIGLELFNLIKSRSVKSIEWKRIIGLCFTLFIGGIFALTILLIPIWSNLPLFLADLTNMVSSNINSSKSTTEYFLSIFDLQQWSKSVKAFVKTLSVFIPAMGLLGAIYKRQISLLVVSFIALFLILSTLVYEFRVIFLLPYFIGFAGGMFQNQRTSITSASNKLKHYLLYTSLAWSIGISIVLKSFFALDSKADLNRNLIYDAASSSIGAGHQKVFLAFTYEFYYVGRALGWKMYTPYVSIQSDSNGNWIRNDEYRPTKQFVKLLSGMDYAVFYEGSITKEISAQLTEAGLIHKTGFSVDKTSFKNSNKENINRTSEIFLWYLRASPHYGSYQLYSRKSPELHSKNPFEI
ncbi:MAG: hypothetical protein JWQ25_892 [Daejeonella sp.]|nr:hypothetical protein [Daejeonella sp.]